jgi:hypothetical protein
MLYNIYRYLERNCWNYLKFCGVIQLLLCTGQDIHAQCIHKTTCLYARKVILSAVSRGLWSERNEHLRTRLSVPHVAWSPGICAPIWRPFPLYELSFELLFETSVKLYCLCGYISVLKYS